MIIKLFFSIRTVYNKNKIEAKLIVDLLPLSLYTLLKHK